MMVRLAVVATFLTVTLGAWVVMKPPSQGRERLANGELLTPAVSLNAADVTRASAVDPVLPAALAMPSSPDVFTATLDAILDGLGFDVAEQVAVVARDDAALPVAEVVVAGIQARKSDAEIAAELQAGFLAGDLAIPAALMTTQGRVDTPVLMASIMSEAKARLGEALPQPAAPVVRYSVVEGDSLAAIAVHMYGDIDAWTVLWEANADLLPNPAQIEAGMQLRVPPR